MNQAGYKVVLVLSVLAAVVLLVLLKGPFSPRERRDAAVRPDTCEGCHDFDGPGPNVMGPSTNYGGTNGKPYDDGAWGYNVNGHGADGTAAAAPDKWSAGAGGPGVACTDCHSLGPTHDDGTLNTSEEGGFRTVNSAHLLDIFIGAKEPGYDVQLTFDNACYTTCHEKGGVTDMRHSRDDEPVANVVQFGKHLTREDGESIAYPVDSDISTNASTAEPDYVVCVSCHDPHGTAVDGKAEGRSTNRMMRDTWISASTLCLACHE